MIAIPIFIFGAVVAWLAVTEWRIMQAQIDRLERELVAARYEIACINIQRAQIAYHGDTISTGGRLPQLYGGRWIGDTDDKR